MDKWNLIKLNNFCTGKKKTGKERKEKKGKEKNISKTKRQPLGWDKIFVN